MNDSIDSRVARLETAVTEIQGRNERVERDKSWETSSFRKLWVLALTYGFTALVFWIIGVDRFFLNALIPTSAYWLSTLSLPLACSIWERLATRPRRDSEDS